MNKSQRKIRKGSDESFTISITNLKFMKIFYELYRLFVFVTYTITAFGMFICDVFGYLLMSLNSCWTAFWVLVI